MNASLEGDLEGKNNERERSARSCSENRPHCHQRKAAGRQVRPRDNPFLETLQELGNANPNFRFVVSMTEMGRSHKK